jgi:hypothetical protein
VPCCLFHQVDGQPRTSGAPHRALRPEQDSKVVEGVHSSKGVHASLVVPSSSLWCTSNPHAPDSDGDVCKMYEVSALPGFTERHPTAHQNQKIAAQGHRTGRGMTT